MNKRSSFESDRLLYRGIIGNDAELIVSWRSNPANYKFFFEKKAISLKEHLEWYSSYLIDETRYDFMIIDNKRNRIGTVGLSHITVESCEISYMIGDISARGQGYATEAVMAMTDIAFRELGVKEVFARIIPGNDASAKVIGKAGYTETERLFRIACPD